MSLRLGKNSNRGDGSWKMRHKYTSMEVGPRKKDTLDMEVLETGEMAGNQESFRQAMMRAAFCEGSAIW